MSQLQTLISSRQNDINEKVAARRAQVEAEYVQPMSKLKMNKLKTKACVEEAVNDNSTFQIDADTNTKTVDECAENTNIANASIGTGLDAVATDIVDTNKKLQSVVESRPGMPGIVLSRR